MPTKYETFAELAARTERMLTDSTENWKAFLTAAARLYKYPYHEQLMIYAQRPDATACADYETWNRRMGRYVRRGSTGIALLDDSGNYPKIRYVFDVSDTGARANSRDVKLWTMEERHTDAVSEALEGNGGLTDKIENTALGLAMDYWNDHCRDILDIVANSFLEEYNIDTIGARFCKAVAVSTSYAVMSRCGMNPDELFGHEDFLPVFEFNTPDTIAALGTAVSDVFERILRQIEAIVKKYEKENEHDNHENRGLQHSESEVKRDVRDREVRQDEEKVPEGTSLDTLQQTPYVGEAIPAPRGDRFDGEPETRTVDGRAEAFERSDRGVESNRPDEVDGADEHSEISGGGTDSERADLQLILTRGEQLSLFPTEGEQIESIERAETIAVSAFSFTGAVFEIILRSSITSDERMRIVAEFEKSKSEDEIAGTMKEIYRCGRGFNTDSGKVAVWFDDDGIRIHGGTKARFMPDLQVLSWSDAVKTVAGMLENGTFATNVELAESQNAEIQRVAQSIWYMNSDISEDVRGNYFNQIVIEGIFPDSTARISEMLKDAGTREIIESELKRLAEDYANDRKVMRMHFHKPDDVLNQVRDLGLERREFSSSMATIPTADMFISDDQIDSVLVGGSSIESSQSRISAYFNEAHSESEKIAFLKNEYGIGGLMPGIPGIWDSSESHDGRGIELKQDGCADVQLSWERIADRIDELIRQERYYAPEVEPKSVIDTTPKSEPEVPEVAAENFHITDEALGEGGAKTKFRMNMDAIYTLKILENQNRNATPEEQETLSKYVGWGGLPEAFDTENSSWIREFKELKAALTEEEYTAARGSTLNAHYTSPVVIKAIYEAVGNMGFKTGNILEPAMGVGNFFGLLPESMKDSRLYGVELDSITGRIAQKLYPKADITVAGFETTDRRDFFDLAVGNVPFGSYKVNDKAYNKLNFSIHDYFVAKTLDQVRTGGVIAFVTSRYTMDKQSSEVRKYIAERADLLGAIRLPNNAFKKNAGTEVTTDIIFLQKRDRPQVIEPDWVHLGKNPDGISVNSYFVEHPEMVLGTLKLDDSMYGNAKEVTCEPIEGVSLADQLHEAISHISGTYRDVDLPDLGDGEEIDTSIPADPNVKNYSYTVVDGEVYYRENSRMVKPNLNPNAESRVKDMVELRDCVQKLIDQQLYGGTDEEIRQSQRELNVLYDDFTSKHGLINDKANSKAFADDSSYYLLCSLEILDEDQKLKRKADMFTKRTIKCSEVATSVDTAAEALALSISEKAHVDLEYMAELTGKSEESIVNDLSGVIFHDPIKQEWQTADEYLSGDVREKLRVAKSYAAPGFPKEGLADYKTNVAALEQAQPKDLDASEIEVRLGATWIDKSYIRQFMLELLDPPFYLRRKIGLEYSEVTSEWNISGKSVDTSNISAHYTYGTERANAYKIIEDTLNLRDVRIYDTVTDADGKERRVLNAKETTLAQQKQQAIKGAFKEWIWKTPDRRHALVQRYNELFNSTRPREYNGEHITFNGMNPEISLREHQKNAVAHILYGGNTLLAHEVGAGKTFEMVAAAMESKRLGLCSKPLFAVPNHLTEQWASEFLRLYPSANILVAKKKDFEPANRKKFCARIATGNYDAVIIGHMLSSRKSRCRASVRRDFYMSRLTRLPRGLPS